MPAETFQIELNNLEETAEFARQFAKLLKPGIMICLYGHIGTGKTTFVKFLGKELGIEEEITSPSFVIINEYYSGKFPVYHFDLYRLEKEGIKSIISELEEYSTDPGAVTFVEWAEYSQGNILEERLDIIWYYDETYSDRRTVELKATGEKPLHLLKQVKELYAHR